MRILRNHGGLILDVFVIVVIIVGNERGKLQAAAADVMMPPPRRTSVSAFSQHMDREPLPESITADGGGLSRIARVLRPLVDRWRTGELPVMRFNHKTHEEVVNFLKFFGDSPSGYFGLDTVHVPSTRQFDHETIPGWLAPPPHNIETNFEVYFDKTAVLHKNSRTSLYNIWDLPNTVMKYHAYCYDPESNPFDAIVTEMYFLNRIAALDSTLTLKGQFYSGMMPPLTNPYVLDNVKKYRVPQVTCPDIVVPPPGRQSSFPDSSPKKIIHVRPHIRYMIMEKCGISLYDYMKKMGGRIGFKQAIKFGIQMINLLKRLHKLNIVHGDAHMGAFAFRRLESGGETAVDQKLILIGFGRSQFFDDNYMQSVDEESFCDKTKKLWLHPYTGKWEMHNCKPAFRDDVYRAVQNVARSMFGIAHREKLQKIMNDSKQEYVRIKDTADFWELEEMVVPVKPGHREAVINHLKMISKLITTDLENERPFMKPNYDEIILRFEAILDVLETVAIDVLPPPPPPPQQLVEGHVGGELVASTTETLLPTRPSVDEQDEKSLRFDHSTRSQVLKYLKMMGDSTAGYFGLDRVHIPSTTRHDRENIPGVFAPPPHNPNEDYTVHLEPLYLASRTSVSAIREIPELVIKYYAYCYDPKREPTDAIVTEMYFMKRIAMYDPTITVRGVFYSGMLPTSNRLVMANAQKNRMPETTCRDVLVSSVVRVPVQPHIRYMIMERCSISMYAFMKQNGKIPFSEAVGAGIKMISLLKRLHRLNIVHGDAHLGNFCLQQKKSETKNRLVLIDFGRAEFVDEQYMISSVGQDNFCDPAAANLVFHPFTSKWHMRNCKRAFRDDVYLAVQMIAMSMHGVAHKEKVWDMINSIDLRPYIRRKDSCDFWELLGLPLPVEARHKRQVMNHLKAISFLASTDLDGPDPFKRPQYDEIISHLKQIMAIVTEVGIERVEEAYNGF